MPEFNYSPEVWAAAGGHEDQAAQLQEGLNSGAYEVNENGDLVGTQGPMAGLRIGQSSKSAPAPGPAGSSSNPMYDMARKRQAAGSGRPGWMQRGVPMGLRQSMYMSQNFDNASDANEWKARGSNFNEQRNEDGTVKPPQESGNGRNYGPGNRYGDNGGGRNRPPWAQGAPGMPTEPPPGTGGIKPDPATLPPEDTVVPGDPTGPRDPATTDPATTVEGNEPPATTDPAAPAVAGKGGGNTPPWMAQARESMSGKGGAVGELAGPNGPLAGKGGAEAAPGDEAAAPPPIGQDPMPGAEEGSMWDARAETAGPIKTGPDTTAPPADAVVPPEATAPPEAPIVPPPVATTQPLPMPPATPPETGFPVRGPETGGIKPDPATLPPQLGGGRIDTRAPLPPGQLPIGTLPGQMPVKDTPWDPNQPILQPQPMPLPDIGGQRYPQPRPYDTTLPYDPNQPGQVGLYPQPETYPGLDLETYQPFQPTNPVDYGGTRNPNDFGGSGPGTDMMTDPTYTDGTGAPAPQPAPALDPNSGFSAPAAPEDPNAVGPAGGTAGKGGGI